MKILLIGKGKSIYYIKKYLKYKKVEVLHAVFEHELNNKYLLADENLLNITDIDYVIKSPGIFETNKTIIKLKEKFTFINEMDLLVLFKENIKCIAISGSNGKTTCVNMLYSFLSSANINCIVCGNSHNPVLKYYKNFKNYDYLIVELSSFQLSDMKFFKPFIATILNMSPNHLDAVYSLKSYYNSKKNIYRYQDKSCYFILNETIKELKGTDSECNSNVISMLPYNNFNLLNKNICKYKNAINTIYTIGKILNIDDAKMISLNKFKCLSYRENIKKIKDVTIINDSKSTSIDATLFAITHIKDIKNTILIIGGKDKQLSYVKLNEYKFFKIICYGELCLKIKYQVKNALLVNDLKDAILLALLLKHENKTILFSPGTSSFDSFKNYKQRGKYFDKYIRKYEKKYIK